LELGKAAASEAKVAIEDAISQRKRARIIVGTGNSQVDVINALVEGESVNWKAVEVFHLDEYVGMSDEHSASFRRWLRTHFVEKVHPGTIHYLRGDALNVEEECNRYAELLDSAPLDLCFLGFGENGHIAFNDPHVANFNDPLIVKRVALDRRCREQQLGEGHFPTLDAVPQEAITLTCSILMQVACLICCVPERRKAEAVQTALEGPLSELCPASIVPTHPRASIFLDTESASLLKKYQEINAE
jgi:glucosamine-6-phosphate deaminase